MAGPSCSSVAWSESPSHRSKRRSHSAWLSSASWSYRSDIRWQHCCTSACSRILSLSLSLSWIRLLLSIDWIDSHSSWPILLGYSFISILFLCLAQVPVLQSFSSAYLPAFLYGQPTLYSSNSAWWEWWPVLLELAALMALFWFTCHWRRMFEIKSFIETTCLPAHGEAALDLDAIRKRPPYQGVTYDFNNRVVNMVPEHYYAIREVFSGHGWKLAFVAYMMAALLTPSLTSLVLLVYLFVIGTYLPGQWVTRALPVLLFYSAIWLAVQSIYQIDFGAIEVRHDDGHPHVISHAAHRLTLNVLLSFCATELGRRDSLQLWSGSLQSLGAVSRHPAAAHHTDGHLLWLPLLCHPCGNYVPHLPLGWRARTRVSQPATVVTSAREPAHHRVLESRHDMELYHEQSYHTHHRADHLVVYVAVVPVLTASLTHSLTHSLSACGTVIQAISSHVVFVSLGALYFCSLQSVNVLDAGYSMLHASLWHIPPTQSLTHARVRVYHSGILRYLY